MKGSTGEQTSDLNQVLIKGDNALGCNKLSHSEHLARKLFNHFKLSIPVDVELLAKKLGFEVHYEDWPDESSGMFFKGPHKSHIIINKNHPTVRQRFTLGHEIIEGIRIHLHLEECNAAFSCDGYPSCKEHYCDKGSSAILMPEWAILYEHMKLQRGSLPRCAKTYYLASLFDVSYAAMERRLEELYLQ
jgi:Zn-dependent peptidase ImmA (M78 family)